jgi:hypothetical protein
MQDWKDIQSYKENQAKHDRESLAGRLQKWKEETELEAKQRRQQEEVDQINRELAFQEYEDMRAYERQMRENRRQSLAYRLDKAKKDKDFEKGQQALQQACYEEEVRLRHYERLDVQKYQEELRQARRQSLQYRNAVAVIIV